MSRGTNILLSALAALAVVALASGAGFVMRRAPRAPAQVTQGTQRALVAAATTTISALDPTWCGRAPGSSNVGELGDAAACGKLSLTGSAPECLFWAECRDDRFQIDCTSSGPGRCRCDGADGLIVSYDPAFCTLDAAHPQSSLRAILDAAAIACQWKAR